MSLTNAVVDPHAVFSISREATVEEIRARYLELVRENPPERDPVKFRAIHQAYQMLCDPLVLARAVVRGQVSSMSLTEICEKAQKNKPRLSRTLLLALGNQTFSHSSS
jgi:hypothetical protein